MNEISQRIIETKIDKFEIIENINMESLLVSQFLEKKLQISIHVKTVSAYKCIFNVYLRRNIECLLIGN